MGLDDFPILKHPPWLSFYTVLQRYNPTKPIPWLMLETMTSDAWPRKKRDDIWIYRQEVSHPRANIGNAPFDEHLELEWSQLNKSDEEIGDSSPHGDSSPEVVSRQDVGVINIKGKDP